MSIQNTSKEGVHPEWLFGGNPDAIERQERKGQEQLAASSQLPAQGSFGEDAREELETHGIKILAREASGLFYDVELPDGWKIEPTDHSMWSNLVDAKGEKIARIFYKAAFYDRHASISFRKTP